MSTQTAIEVLIEQTESYVKAMEEYLILKKKIECAPVFLCCRSGNHYFVSHNTNESFIKKYPSIKIIQ